MVLSQRPSEPWVAKWQQDGKARAEVKQGLLIEYSVFQNTKMAGTRGKVTISRPVARRDYNTWSITRENFVVTGKAGVVG